MRDGDTDRHPARLAFGLQRARTKPRRQRTGVLLLPALAALISLPLLAALLSLLSTTQATS